MNDKSIMPFGKHKGKQLDQVPDDYLVWLHGQFTAWEKLDKKISQTQKDLFQYIDDNLDVLEG